MSAQIFEVKHEFIGAGGNKLAASIFSTCDNVDESFALAKKQGATPLILLHGGGQTRHSWQKSAEQLAAISGIAISVDSRGHGESEWLADKAYGVADYADDTISIAREIEIRCGAKPIAIGASLGGISALLGQDRAGQSLLSALVLVDITPRISEAGVSKILGFMAERVKDGFGSVEEAAEAIATYMPNRKKPKNLNGLQKNLRLGDDGRWRWHWDPAFLDSRMDSQNDGELWLERGLAAVSALKIPTLLVRGSKSELIQQEHVDEFLSLAPHAKYVDVNDAGHMVAGDKNDVFFEGIKGFLRDEGLI